MTVLYRPLLFVSVDPDLAAARGVPTGLVGVLLLFVLTLSVTEAAQIVGTLLVLSLAITPAAAAQRLLTRPGAVSALSVLFALLASDVGLVLSLQFSRTRPSAPSPACSPGSSGHPHVVVIGADDTPDLRGERRRPS